MQGVETIEYLAGSGAAFSSCTVSMFYKTSGSNAVPVSKFEGSLVVRVQILKFRFRFLFKHDNNSKLEFESTFLPVFSACCDGFLFRCIYNFFRALLYK